MAMQRLDWWSSCLKGLLAEAEALASKRHTTIGALVAEVIPDSSVRSLRRALAGPREARPVSWIAPPSGASAEFVDQRPTDERITIQVPPETAAALSQVYRRMKGRGRGRVSRSEGVVSALLAHLLPNGAWLQKYIEDQQGELRDIRVLLTDLRAGKKRGRKWAGWQGWSTPQEAVAARVKGLRAWVAVLRAPDASLAKFIAREDLQLSHHQTRATALAARREKFLEKYAHPDWQAAKGAREREKRRRRREEEKLNRTGKIDRMAIYEREEGICFFCGKPVDVGDFHVHHMTAISRGGAHGPENMRVAHLLCNDQDGARLRGARQSMWG